MGLIRPIKNLYTRQDKLWKALIHRMLGRVLEEDTDTFLHIYRLV
jgi:hypothetical protein